MAIINEFIDALAIEIDALKKWKGGSIVTVYNGELIRKALDFYIYQFTLENFLIVLDDTPANIEVNGKEYDCDIISVSGQQVQISIKQKLAELIPIAKIKTNTWYLLERLKKKYEDNLNSQSRFENSNRLFLDKNSKIEGGDFTTSYSINGKDNPNTSQHKAIESSINDFISIIWGPPGTGKTETIARAIECHLNLGRKVLLLSHSNNAVDQALIKVALQMINNTYYKEGHLVRLGKPKAEMLNMIEAKTPFVLMDNIVEIKSKQLIREKRDLIIKLEQLQTKTFSYEYVTILDSIINENFETITKSDDERQNLESKINSLNDDLINLQNQISDMEEKLNKSQSAGFIKRTFLGLDPIKIDAILKKVNNDFTIKSNEIKNVEIQLKQIIENIDSLKSVKIKSEKELSNQLLRFKKTIKEIKEEIIEINNEVKQIQVRLDVINKSIEEIKSKIISDSKLVATTLTKSYISKEIETTEFDILIVDEVSMAPMPMLYWAASKVKKGITIVGDFLQLPPICVSDDDLAKKWLGRSIFNQLNISEISKAVNRPVQLLNEQYRMHPCISEIINKKIYENHLKDHKSTYDKIKFDSISGNSAVCLIDTFSHNPWCSQFEAGGRFNLINALISVKLAEKIIESYDGNETIGIITPYRNQARLLLKIAEDRGLIKKNKEDRIKVNTVHSFQGGEETVIIFDSVEGEGAKKWSMINEFDNIESAKLLLNVAITRAKTKLYIIANSNYIKSYFPNNSLFIDILRHFIDKGKEVQSTEILSNLRDENFEFWISKLNSLNNRPENIGTGYRDDFWPAFHNDLSKAKKELIIFSPFLTSQRLGKLHLIFNELLSKGIKIYVITLSPNEQPPLMRDDANKVMIKLKEMDVVLKFRQGMHEKIALIDREIKWIGSLNILSHNSRKEYMERIKGESSVKELFEKFDLDNLLINQNINGEFCPQCKDKGIINFIIPKFSRQNRQMFYGCSSYPACDFTANIKTRTFEDSNKKKTDSRKRKQSTSNNSSENKISSQNQNNNDLFGNNTNGQQWETKLCYWSSIKLPGYSYSKNKNAWWKKK